jgi:tetratricopeptide (TPR) repeat protein
LRARALAIGSDFARLQGDIEGARTFSEESLSLSRELGDLRSVARALHELREAALAEEKFDSAVELFQEAVKTAQVAGYDGAGSIGNLGYVALLQGDYARARTLSEEAVQLLRERGHQSGVAVGLTILADAELLLGCSDEARLRTKESLELAGELGFKEVIASGLDTTAALIVHEQAVRAARLIGAADALREEIRLSQTPAEHRIHRTHATLRASLGDEVVDQLRDEGRALHVQEAVAYALASLD